MQPESVAARALLARMMKIAFSQKNTTWVFDLEFDLWEWVVEPGTPEQHREGRELERLALACGGWWCRSEEGRLELLPLETWCERYATR